MFNQVKNFNSDSVMRQAFINAKLAPNVARKPVVQAALQSLENGAGTLHNREWNAHLSFKTFKQLQSKGIM